MFGLTVLKYQEVLTRRKEFYYTALTSGKVTPFIYPWDTAPVLYLFFALVIGPRLSYRKARVLYRTTFAAVTGHVFYLFTQRRSLGFASGYGIGLSMCWGVIMAAVLLLVSDGPNSYARLEVRRIDTLKDEPSTALTRTNGSAAEPENDLRQRKVNGNTTIHQDKNEDRELVLSQAPNSKIVWQKFPTSLYHCIDWCLDLMTSFRGPNWNFRIPTLPPIDAPELVDKSIKLSYTINTDRSKNVVRTGPQTLSRGAYDLECIKTFFTFYMIVDFLKTLMITDPYFLGIAPLTSPSPWRFIQPLHTTIPFLPLNFLTRFFRLTVGLCAIISCLCGVMSLSPLVFHTILPRLINVNRFTSAPLSEQWTYAPFFYAPFPAIADKGLAGFWGKCWHQMFRYGISEPSPPLIRKLNIDPKSQTGRAIQLLVAFGLTGLIHACASYTSFSLIPSHPLGPLLFFPLQALGILFQTAVSIFVSKTLGLRLPKLVRQIGNTLFVVAWGYATAPMLVDDFARCGVWLFEPFPVSVMRPWFGGGWWCWETLGEWVGIWPGVQGRRGWYDTGIAFF